MPKGGPDGGDGGKGGDVILRVEPSMTTLLDYRYRKHFYAGNGEAGKGKNRAGKQGKSLVLPVPPGTSIYRLPGKTLITDLMEGEYIIAHGGKGGRGNYRFRSSTRRRPHEAEPGEPGEELEILLELKLLADVGIIGLPNAGKSTLLAKLSSARPKIADYPFTSLTPTLGRIITENRAITLVDIPGLIEGACEGKGLGNEFLAHIARTRLLLFLLDPTQGEPKEQINLLEKEIGEYNKELLDRPRLIAINKIDRLGNEGLEKVRSTMGDDKIFYISALYRIGLDKLAEGLIKWIES